MKKIFFALVCIITFFVGSTQQLPLQISTDISDVEREQDYLQKSKNQKLVGGLLASGGVAMLTIGMLQFLSDFSDGLSFSSSSSGERGSKDFGEGFCIAGGVALAGSLPFLLASRRNNRKARLLAKNNTTYITPSFRITQAAFGIAIPIGR
ncbi:hypothetical protein HRG84_03730 [Flavisolibacter sp. BT320]|nr:hypothetical protein [Flavisolibacter longurius]